MPRKTKETKQRRRNRALDAVQEIGTQFDLPPQVLPGYSHIEMIGNREAMIEGVHGVLTYDEHTVSLNLGRLIATFEGCELNICSFQFGHVILGGMIAAIHFSNEQGV
ncbi:MAG: YabP/YqfC family sporulation protein [Oscillospiraceae bacterium]|nr:YabP/YqfC family sporulation protein [Oscillospiraceae bacterium]